MLNLTWKIFYMTGNIDTYLLIKELEKKNEKKNAKVLNPNLNLESDSSIH